LDINALKRCAIAVCVTAAVAAAVPASAQDPAWAPAYPLRITPERAAALVRAYDGGLPYVPGEVIIKFRSGVTDVAQQNALRVLRSRPSVASLRRFGDLAVLRDPLDDDAVQMAARLSAQPEVEYAEPNYLHHPVKTPNDPGFDQHQWNLKLIDLPRAWDINPGATPDVKVAIIDSGLTEVTQSFQFPTWNGRDTQIISVPFRVNPEITASRIVDPVDFVFWDGPVLDMDGHGTHVASTVGEDTNNGVAEAGVAYNVGLMPLKICVGYWEVQFVLSANGYRGFAPPGVGGCDVASEAEAIRYAADHGVQAINLSVGGESRSTPVLDALKYAVGKGVFIAIAAGNSYDEGNPVEYPAGYAADINGAMAVAAVGRSNLHAYYSSSGSHIEIAAPGGDVHDGGVDGLVWQSTIYLPDSDPETVLAPRFDRYAETPEQGTSMASPHVAGVAALLYSQGVHDAAAVEALIKATAQDLGTAGRDDLYGYGLIQPRRALFGFGLTK